MRIAISNRFWATAGGGESYALAFARALSTRGDVELITPPGVDWNVVADRLQVPVDDFALRVVDMQNQGDVRAVSAGYDLFVNTTWGDDLVPSAKRNALVVHFPRRPPEADRGWFGAALARLFPVARAVVGEAPLFVAGFHPVERTTRPFRWTNGDAVVALPPRARDDGTVTLVFGGERPAPADVVIESGGQVRANRTIATGEDTTVTFDPGPPPRHGRTLVRIRSGTFSPREALGIADDRRLGVQLVGVRAGARPMSRLFQGASARAEQLAVYHSYDRLIVTSEFTAEWFRRWWGEDAAVVHPAVAPKPRLRKEPIILSVGRFFPPSRGHSKGQLELVRAFRRLERPGWTLHLVGGCQDEDRDYLEHVRAAATGLAVRFHVDAPGRAVTDLFGRASVFWHATGFMQPPSAPERHEHFGISVVEGMSAGAVPIVYGIGGPASTVRVGTDGFHFASEHELVASTRRVIDDDELRARMAASSQRRAEDYSFAAMQRELLAAVDLS